MIKFYPPKEGFSQKEVQHGHHWLHADFECPKCGKVQPVAATGYIGGPCVRCGFTPVKAGEVG